MSKTILINGAKLHYNDTETDLPAIVTLHGAPGMSNSSGDWRVYADLADRYRIISYDQRGSGSSEQIAPFSFEQFCADLEELRRKLDLGKIVIAGGSYGGMIALQYATRFQHNLHAVVLRDTAASNDFEHLARDNAFNSPYVSDQEGVERMFRGETFSDDDFREQIRQIMPLYNVIKDPERDAAAVAAMQIHHATHNWAFARNNVNYDVRPLLPFVDVPVLITVGRHDWITPVEASEELHSLLPNSELVVFENSGHSPQQEEKELWQATIRDFLQRHGAYD